MHLQEKQYK